MTMTIEASTDHATPYPVVPSAPCCGQPITNKEPIPPADVLMGMVVTYPTAMNPALRGLLGTQVDNTPLTSNLKSALGILGCCGSRDAKRTAVEGLRGLRAFDTSLLEEAIELARGFVPSLTLPPSPLDVIDSIWRLAEVEREIVSMRTKLQTMRAAGVIQPIDVEDFNTLRANYFAAAKPVYNATVRVIAMASPTAVTLVPPLRMPPGLEGAPEPLPFVPDRNDLTRIRAGDLTGFSSAFQSLVDEARRRLRGGGSVSGLGEPIVAGTVSATLLAVLVAVVVIALVIGIALSAEAIANVMIVWAQAFAHARTVASRERVYMDCSSRGGSAGECAAAAQTVAPTPDVRPVSSLISGGLIFGAAAVAAAWYFFGTESGRANAAKIKASFSGVKLKKRRRRRR